jgi:hypothetical protein
MGGAHGQVTDGPLGQGDRHVLRRLIEHSGIGAAHSSPLDFLGGAAGLGVSAVGSSIQKLSEEFSVASDGEYEVSVSSDDLRLSAVVEHVIPGLLVVVVVLAT